MKKCILVMTDSDLVSKLYDDDELTGLYANPMLVADDIDNASFVGWEVQLPAVPAVGDGISLYNSDGRDSLFTQWTEKVANKDEALCYFLGMVKKEPQFREYLYNSSGERVDDAELIKRILCGVDTKGSEGWNLSEGLFDGCMTVDKRIFIPDCDTVVLGVKHSL